MPSIGAARFLEKLGIRRFYRLLTVIGNDRMLSFDELPTYTKAKLKELRDDVRYFSWANFFRGILYVPVIIALWPLDHPYVVGSLIFLVSFHFVCIMLEFYKGTLMDFWMPQMEDTPDDKRHAKDRSELRVDPHWWFSGKAFESVDGYRRIGLEWFRQLVVSYTNKTKFTKEEIKAGKRVEYLQGGTMESVVKYERDTRVGEMMHMAALAFNVAPFGVFLLRHSWFFVGLVGFILWLDLYLVLLQRYNRLRVHKILVRGLRGRPKAAVPATESNGA